MIREGVAKQKGGSAIRVVVMQEREWIGVADARLLSLSVRQPEVFRELFERHYDAVWRYLCVRGGGGVADDLASETFVRAFAARGKYAPRGESALPWLYGIAANLISDTRRTEARRLRAYARTGLVESDGDACDDIVARLSAQALGRELAAALAELRTEDRETLFLSAIAGLSHAETAEALGVAEGTIGARLSRIRAQLRSMLGQFRPTEEATR